MNARRVVALYRALTPPAIPQRGLGDSEGVFLDAVEWMRDAPQPFYMNVWPLAPHAPVVSCDQALTHIRAYTMFGRPLSRGLAYECSLPARK